MIYRHASAALLLRDGFTGRPLSSGAQVFARLDGAPVRPVWKAGGYLVLTDLAPGPHVLHLRHRCFQEEQLAFEAVQARTWETEVDLLPGPEYPFRVRPARLELTVFQAGVPLAGEQVWIGRYDPAQLKLAQDGGQASGTDLRLYCKGDPQTLPIPGWFMAPDRNGPELLHLLFFRGETGTLEAPMSHPHPRGLQFLPARPYRTDGAGGLAALFPEEGELCLYCRGRLRQARASQEGGTLEWHLEEEG